MKKGISLKLSRAQKKLSSIAGILDSVQNVLESASDVKEHMSGVFDTIHRLKGGDKSTCNQSVSSSYPESEKECDSNVESVESKSMNGDISSDPIELDTEQVEEVLMKDEDITVYDLEEDESSIELSEHEAGSFEHGTQKLSNALGDVAKTGLQDPEAVARALGALVEVAADTIKYVENQKTKQEEIRAQRDVAIAQINATSDLIKAYLDKTFDERKEIFNKQFEVVDEALRTGNNQMLAISLQSINSLAAQSPFKNLSDINEVKAALSNEDTVWDI